MKSEPSLLRISVAGLSLVAAVSAFAACSTTDAADDSSAAGAGGTGASGGSAGATNNAVACPAATMATLLDFSLVDGGPSETFGDFTHTFSGSTFFYPTALAADFSAENWHVTGMVGDYAGLGLVFNNCTKVDLSAFKGITFSVKGSIPAPTGAQTLTLSVGTAADDIASAWLNSHKSAATVANVADNFGRCMPTSTQYDNSCAAPSYVVPVTDTATVINVTWAQLLGGSPTATVNPSEITSIVWIIPAPAGAGTAAATPYALDVTLDDIGLIP
jgi:hypothetical protein